MSDESLDLSESEYLVEKILDKKMIKGSEYYLIKWEGYPISECTWEPKSNLTNSKDILRKFELEYNNRSKITAHGKSSPKILGMKETDNNDKKGYVYAAQWDNNDPVFYNTEELAQKWPRLLIDYLEKHVSFKDDDDA